MQFSFLKCELKIILNVLQDWKVLTLLHESFLFVEVWVKNLKEVFSSSNEFIYMRI